MPGQAAKVIPGSGPPPRSSIGLFVVSRLTLLWREFRQSSISATERPVPHALRGPPSFVAGFLPPFVLESAETRLKLPLPENWPRGLREALDNLLCCI